VIAAGLLVAACSALGASSSAGEGTLAGVVLNVSRQRIPAGRAEVVLRVALGGQFVPFRETTADAQGRFLFEHLPLGKEYLYLPGANCDGIHYPGPRIQLTAEHPHTQVELTVCDAVTQPSPLVIRRQEIVIHPEPGALRVTESILVDNPTATCYVGQAADEAAAPVTLRLAIPANFERTTFDEEFFGRRFSLVDGKLVTSVPWLPGQRELKFTYVLPNQQRCAVWQRPLDLPCAHVRVAVDTASAQEISCNLPRAAEENSAAVVFASAGQTLPAGHVLHVALGHPPVPLMAYARWLAALILGGLIAGTSLVMFRRRPARKGPPGSLE